MKRERRQACAEQRRQPRRRGVDAEHLHRRGGQPVEERRLVEERQAVLRRHQPVAGAQHLPGDADVAAFVGQRERMQADREGEPATARRAPPTSARSRARRRGGGRAALRSRAGLRRHSSGRNKAAQTVQSIAADQSVALANCAPWVMRTMLKTRPAATPMARPRQRQRGLSGGPAGERERQQRVAAGGMAARQAMAGVLRRARPERAGLRSAA